MAHAPWDPSTRRPLNKRSESPQHCTMTTGKLRETSCAEDAADDCDRSPRTLTSSMTAPIEHARSTWTTSTVESGGLSSKTSQIIVGVSARPVSSVSHDSTDASTRSPNTWAASAYPPTPRSPAAHTIATAHESGPRTDRSEPHLAYDQAGPPPHLISSVAPENPITRVGRCQIVHKRSADGAVSLL
jgi:hypothetical protein